MPRLTAVLGALALVVPLVTGCGSAAMEVPGDLADVARMPVEGRGGWRGSQRAAFGIWEATDVDRSWTKGSGWRIGLGRVGGGSSRAAQEYSFRFLEAGAEQARVGCATTGSGGGVSVGVDVRLSGRQGLECRPVDAAAAPDSVEPAWDLVLGATRDRHLEGFLRVGEDRYAVVSTGPGGKYAPAEPFGFEIRGSERTLAAVEVVNDGAVWLAPELVGERRTVFAAVAAALLLYDRLEAD